MKNEPVKSFWIHLHFHINAISVNYDKVTPFKHRLHSIYNGLLYLERMATNRTTKILKWRLIHPILKAHVKYASMLEMWKKMRLKKSPIVQKMKATK